MKKCNVCKRYKKLSKFFKTAASKDGLSYCCRYCNSIRTLKWQRDNMARHYEHVRKYKRGIDSTTYDKMLKQQKYSCAICNRHESKFKIKFAIDHNHKTKEVRGLLCSNCNTAIGLLQDNPKLCIKASKYLKVN